MKVLTRRETIAGGVAGTKTTLDRMAELVNGALAVPEVRDQVVGILAGCAGRDYRCQLATLRAWLAAHFRFLRDPFGVEYLQAPAYQLARIHRDGVTRGDCDDAAILAGALLKTAGFPARFVALGFFPRKVYSHVYTEALHAGRWWEFDITRPLALPKLPTRHLLTQPI